jgi:hypothetical protein
MEEQQIQAFVQRVSADEHLRRELQNDASAVVNQQGFTPQVAQVMLRLAPHLAVAELPRSVRRWWD